MNSEVVTRLRESSEVGVNKVFTDIFLKKLFIISNNGAYSAYFKKDNMSGSWRWSYTPSAHGFFIEHSKGISRETFVKLFKNNIVLSDESDVIHVSWAISTDEKSSTDGNPSEEISNSDKTDESTPSVYSILKSNIYNNDIARFREILSGDGIIHPERLLKLFKKEVQDLVGGGSGDLAISPFINEIVKYVIRAYTPLQQSSVLYKFVMYCIHTENINELFEIFETLNVKFTIADALDYSFENILTNDRLSVLSVFLNSELRTYIEKYIYTFNPINEDILSLVSDHAVSTQVLCAKEMLEMSVRSNNLSAVKYFIVEKYFAEKNSTLNIKDLIDMRKLAWNLSFEDVHSYLNATCGKTYTEYDESDDE